MNRRAAPIFAALGVGVIMLGLIASGIYFVAVRDTASTGSEPVQSVSLPDDGTPQQPDALHVTGGNLDVTGHLSTASLEVTGGTSLQDVSVEGQLHAHSLDLAAVGDQSTSGKLYVATDGSLNYSVAGSTLNISEAASRQIPTVTPSVLSLQGQTGNISLVAGNGVAINGTTISNTGVTSFGGSHGAITIGSGLSLDGTTLNNNGVQSISSLSANILIATDNHGNLTIQDAGTGSGGTVSLAPATAQTDASNYASIAVNKTGTGNLIQLSTGVSAVNRFVVDNTGAITSGNISFGQVTGVPSFVSTIGGGSGALTLGSGLALSGQTISNTGVVSLGGATGALTLGNGLTISGGQLSATGSGIASVTGTPNQVIVSGTGNLTLSLPQSIATSSSPTFAGLTLTGALAGTTGSFTGAVSGANATTNNQFTTLSQVNGLIAASGAGSGVNSLNGQTGALSIQGNGQIAIDASTSPSIKLSIQGDSIGNAQLAYDTGQNLTTTSTPTFAALTVSGGGVFTGTVSGAGAVSGSDFVTKDQLNTAVGSIGGGSVIGGSGTTNKIAMFTGANTVGDSILAQSDADSNGTPDTITVTGTLAATTLQGDGSGVANVDAVTLQGHSASYFTDASNLVSGTVASARVSGNYAGITGLGVISSGTWQGNVLTDPYVADNLTISSGGSVDWSALDNYPAACGAGQAISALGDTPTCQTFLTGSSADGSYVQLQPTTSGTAQTGNLKVTGAIQGGTGSFTGTVTGADATANNQFATLGQVNGLITASGAGAGVNSLNGLTGGVTLQGNGQIVVTATSPNINLSIQGDSIGNAQLAYDTGQTLTTTSTPTFAGLSLTGNLASATGSFTGTVSGANATANNQFVTLAQLNTAVGGVGGVTTVGALNGGTANMNGATINGSTIYLQSASATMPGLVDTGTQTFAGDKTFNGNVGIASGKTLTVGGAVTFQNSIDSTSAFNVKTSTGSSVLKVDTTNGFVGINNNSPVAPLDVTGVGPSYTNGFESGSLSPFTTSDPTKWSVQSIPSAHAGSYALVANYNANTPTNTGPYTVSVTQTLSAPGVVSFYYNCDNPWFSTQTFQIDSGIQNSLNSASGNCNNNLTTASSYAFASYGVSAGTHTFTWGYSNITTATYRLRIDDVKITNVGATGTAALFNNGGVGIGLGTGIQPAATLDVNGTANVAGTLTVGKASTTSGALTIANATSANAVTVVSAPQAGNYTVTIPITASNDTFCLQSLGNCAPATGNFIQNQNSTQQASSNFWIDGTGRADTALQAPTIDTATAGALNIGTTNATGINLNQNTTLAAGKGFTITGGATGTRPAAPTKGQIYYDTTTNTLLTYNGTKWMGDKSTATKVVADGSTSQDSDGADYTVSVGATNADVTINAAIASLPASGGTVYLKQGTYLINATITLPANVTLAGSGASTIIKIHNALNANVNAISTNGNNIVIRNLMLDGNKANNSSGTQVGITNTGSGSQDSLTSIIVQNFNNVGVNLTGCCSLVGYSINGSTIQNNGSDGVYLGNYTGKLTISNSQILSNSGSGINTATTGTPGYLVITGNYLDANTGDGIGASGDTNSTITGNIVKNSGGIGISSAANSVVSGNTISASGTNGIQSCGGSDNISDNTIIGFGASSPGIDIAGCRFAANNNTSVTNNLISNTTGTGPAIALEGFASLVSGTYLAGNHFTGSGANGIQDGGIGTIYSNQLDANGNLINTGVGAMTIGTTTVNGTLSLQGGVTTTQLPTPSTPTIGKTGTAGTTSYSYVVTALDGTGETLPSASTTITTGNATLSATNYNTVTWKEISGATKYRIYRTASAGTPSTTGLIGTVAAAGGATQAFNDTGLAATTAVPTTNTTGGATIANALQAGSSLTLGTSSSIDGTITFKSATNANTLTVVSAPQTGNYTATIPVLASNDTFCMQLAGNCSGAGGSYIQSQNVSQQVGGTFWISGTGRSDTSLQAPLFDTATAGILSIGTTNATGINLDQNVTVASGKSITLVGGASGTRPAAPTKGQIYYDTTTNTLLTYNGTKWMSDQKTANKIVAMGTATGCTGTSPVASSNADGADFVVTSCTSAQTTIAAAIAALPASGGTIYLEDGTYIIDNTLTIPSNVTLAGDGAATTLKVKDSASGMLNGYLYVPSGSSRVTIQNLRFDGNAANQTSGNDAIQIRSTGLPGTTVTNIESTNVNGHALNVLNASNVTVSNSSFTNTVGGNPNGAVNVQGSSNNVFTGNNISGNTYFGMNLANTQQTSITGNIFVSNAYGVYIGANSKYATITGNTFKANSGGIYVGSSTYNTISSNTISGSTGATNSYGGINLNLQAAYNNISSNTITGGAGPGIYSYGWADHNNIESNSISGNAMQGIWLDNLSDNTQVSGNHLYDNGGTGSYNSIDVSGGPNGSTNNTITNNTIVDTAGTGYAISIGSNASATYLSGNLYNGTGATSIKDQGKGTIWSSQLDGNGNTINTGAGGMTVGASTVNGTLSLQGGITSVALPKPATPTLNKVGTAGATSYSYVITALDGTGETLPSNTTTISSSNAVLSSTNYNTITWSEINGATSYKIYRTASAGTPSTTGLIGTVAATGGTTQTFNDTGMAATTAVPAANTTGGATFSGAIQGSSANITGGTTTGSLTVTGATTMGQLTASGVALFKNTTNSTTAFQIQKSDSTPLLVADTTNMTVTIAKLVTGDITVNGHIITGGTAPTIAAGVAACTAPTVSITGNDTAGVITVTAGSACASAGTLVTVTFNKAFGIAPQIMLTPKTTASAGLGAFNGTSSTTSFTLDTSSATADATTYTFNYLAIQ